MKKKHSVGDFLSRVIFSFVGYWLLLFAAINIVQARCTGTEVSKGDLVVLGIYFLGRALYFNFFIDKAEKNDKDEAD